ncbi:MAG TPA: STAS domain-containing protein [Bacteroidota bacterium]
MNFEVTKNGSATVFKLKERRLDSSLSAELKGEFILLCRPKLGIFIIDLSEVEFCDSSGLSALLIAERQIREHGGKVKLAGMKKKVMSLIKISQLDRVFEIHQSVREALKT